MKRKIWIALALVIVMVLAGVTVAAARAGVGLRSLSKEDSTVDVTFTKWFTSGSTMEGVVGGAVGSGTFAGTLIQMKTDFNDTNMAYAEATYEINGSKHTFTAHIHALQDNTLASGVIIGNVTDGWLNGAILNGEYKLVPAGAPGCPNEGNVLGVCFQGVLHLHPAGSND